MTNTIVSHPFLSADAPAITHTNAGATDSQNVPGPTEIGRIPSERIKRVPGGIITINYAGKLSYPDGTEATWNANNNRVAKIRMDGDHWELLAEMPITGMQYMPPDEVNRHLNAFDSSQSRAELATYLAQNLPYYAEAQAREAGIYTLADERGDFYVLTRSGVNVYGQADSSDPRSAIVLLRQWQIPEALKRSEQIRQLLIKRMESLGVTLSPEMRSGLMRFSDVPLGINMTYDGHLVFTMVGGNIIVVDRDFAKPAQTFLIKDEILANSLSIDEQNGLYVVSDRNMYKLVWTGETISDAEFDGAWKSPYDLTEVPLPGVRGGGTGSGTTPSLMGDWVVIADGEKRMNLVAFWRNDIPADFVQQPGTQSRRIAAQIPVSMGGLDSEYIQTEVSIAVWGDYAFVVNGMAPENIKPDLDNLLMQGPLIAPPKGVELFQRDRSTNQWRSMWAHSEVSTPAAVIPLISAGSHQAYTMAWDDEGWYVAGFDLKNGELKTEMNLGYSQAYNGAWGQLQLLPDGDIFIPGLAGPVRILTQ
ncbi:hypothetical protein E3W66_08740 [Gammaproteobacteria bacterium LSUCC0057]|uniref:Uncharacterized protein n=1 Tax=Gammaproteobacteria bacterium LSUCC0057 TaxID=2559237 RepID=A0A4Y8UFQ8_9GAMM|nr:hypothetical protein E3W66_08740 [Gammaproteobacteria bacterium LSUCC0057]